MTNSKDIKYLIKVANKLAKEAKTEEDREIEKELHEVIEEIYQEVKYQRRMGRKAQLLSLYRGVPQVDYSSEQAKTPGSKGQQAAFQKIENIRKQIDKIDSEIESMAKSYPGINFEDTSAYEWVPRLKELRIRKMELIQESEYLRKQIGAWRPGRQTSEQYISSYGLAPALRIH